MPLCLAGDGSGEGREHGLLPSVAMGAAAGMAAAEPREGGKEMENNWGEQGRRPQPGHAGGAARHVPLRPPQRPLPAALAPHAAPQRPGARGVGGHLVSLGAGGRFGAFPAGMALLF